MPSRRTRSLDFEGLRAGGADHRWTKLASGWRDRGVVRAVAVDEVARMLQGCDRRTGTGRRDFAILTVLARLGLRRGEVAALSVDDINWRTGELVVTGKGHRREFLPLPVDVVRRSPSTVGAVAATGAAAPCSCVPWRRGTVCRPAASAKSWLARLDVTAT